MQKQIYIIGSGRNGSKLLAELLSQGTNITKFGEVGALGPAPTFYKLFYENKIDELTAATHWKYTREIRMINSKEIYLEKNHLIVPMLNTVKDCFPDAKFIWLRREYEDIVRSFMNRPTYEASDMAGEYGKGRLVPRESSLVYDSWNELSKQKKVEWLVQEYENLCLQFSSSFSKDEIENKFGEVWYEHLTADYGKTELIEALYEWLEIEGFDEDKINNTYSIQLGTSTDEKLTGLLPEGRTRQ